MARAWQFKRPRARSLWLLWVSVGAALVAVLVSRIAGAPSWLQITAAAVAALVGLLVPELRALWAQDDKDAATVRANVASGSDELKRLDKVETGDVRVHEAIEDVPYVDRDVEPQVEERLRDRRVLIVGPSMAGKTRLALQITRHVYSKRRLLEPKDGNALHELVAGGLIESGLVIWLDDLERYLSGGNLTREVLGRFHAQGNVLVATIRSKAYGDLLPVGELRPEGWDVPEWFGKPVWLREWSDEELRRAEGQVREEVLEPARRYGLSEYLGGGPLALNHLHAAQDTHPVGHALVQASGDWRRAGVSVPVPQAILATLLPAYLDDPSQQTTADAIAAELAWAIARLAGSVSLLEKRGDGYALLDYVLDHFSKLGAPIPQQLWDGALAYASSSDLVSLGYEAAARHDRPDVAEKAFKQSVGTPVAAFNLGVLLAKQGDLDEAAAAYGLAIKSEHPDEAPKAALNLGVLLAKQGDLDEAAAAYGLAIKFEHPDAAPRAALNLGVLLAKRDDLDEAAVEFRRAIKFEHPDAAPKARVNLGMLLTKRGDLDGAAAEFRRAIESKHAEAAPAASKALQNLS